MAPKAHDQTTIGSRCKKVVQNPAMYVCVRGEMFRGKRRVRNESRRIKKTREKKTKKKKGKKRKREKSHRARAKYKREREEKKNSESPL
jgi:hypothetical protein